LIFIYIFRLIFLFYIAIIVEILFFRFIYYLIQQSSHLLILLCIFIYSSPVFLAQLQSKCYFRFWIFWQLSFTFNSFYILNFNMNISARFNKFNGILNKIRKNLSKRFFISLHDHTQIAYIQMLYHIKITIFFSYNIKRKTKILTCDSYLIFYYNTLKYRYDILHLGI
jgi:hypothetical protein